MNLLLQKLLTGNALTLSRSLVVLTLPLSVCLTPAAIINWTNTAGGNWNAAANWSPNAVPGVSDTAVITNAGTYSVAVNAAVTIAGLQLGGASGAQTLANASQTLTLNGSGTVSANGVFTQTGGTTTGSGSLSVAGSLNWSGGTMGLTGGIANTGTATISGGGVKVLTGQLANSGQLIWTLGQWNLNTGSELTNLATGTFDIQAGLSLANPGGTAKVGNAGLLKKSAGAGAAVIDRTFINTGTVDVQSGILDISGGGTNSGAITIPSGGTLRFSATYTLAAGSSVTGAGQVAFSGGTIGVDGTYNITGTNAFVGATVNFIGGYTLDGLHFHLQSGTVFLPNALTVPQLTISSGTLNSSNTITVSGPLNFVGGSLTGAGDIFANGGVSLTGGSVKTLTGHRLINAATLTWSGGQLNLGAGSELTNLVTGTVDIQVDDLIGNPGGTARVGNAGLLKKSAGAGTAQIDRQFINTGTVNIESGTVTLNGGGTNFNIFTVASGTALRFSANHTLAPGCSLTGAGQVIFDAGTIGVGGTYNITGTNAFIGATVNFIGSYTLDGLHLHVQSGSVFLPNALSVPQLTISGGTLNSSNTISVSGPLNFAGGSFIGAGDIFANGGVNVTGGGVKTLNGHRLINSATLTWSGGQLNLGPGSELTNLISGTVDIQVNDLLGNPAGSARVGNAGLWKKSAGTGTAQIDRPFINTGTVNVQSGTLTLSAGGTNFNIITVPSGTALRFQGNYTLAPGSSLTGAGQVIFDTGIIGVDGTYNITGTNAFIGATVNFIGSYTLDGLHFHLQSGTVFLPNALSVPQFTISSGTLNSSNTITVSGPLNFSGGTISGAGDIFANGGVSLTGGSLKTLTGHRLINAATFTWAAGQLNLGAGSVLTNLVSGTVDWQVDTSLGNPGGVATVGNAGLWRKVAGNGNSTIDRPFVNTGTVEVQTGTLYFSDTQVQTAGNTFLNGGNVRSDFPLRIEGGSLSGFGTVIGSVTNNGAVSPGTSPGQLTVQGTYTQTTNGVLNIELAGAPDTTNYDRLVVTGTAVLAGSLNATLTNYYPAPNVSFTNIVRGTNRSGTFANFYYPSNIVGLQATYGTTNVNIDVINTLPSLPPIAPQNVNEMVLLSLNAGASDADAPAQTLSYSLLNSPAGASINGAGQITWTPTESQGPISTNITVVVTDNGTPNLTSNITFAVTVNEINVAPVLNVPGTQIITEQTPLTGVSVSATDSDEPINPIIYSLVAPPGGMTINPASGAIAWTPTEAQGSNIFTITVVATDTNALAINPQSLSTTNTFNIIVNESNRPPVLTVPANQTLTEETALTGVSASATDPDSPANALTYSLVSPPSGLIINPSSGAFTWTPTEAQGSNTYTVTVVVTDTNPPAINTKSFNVTNTFTITVNESNRPPVLTPPANQILTEETPLTGVSASATDPDSPVNALTYSLISPPGGMTINAASGLIAWTPTEAQGSNFYTVTIVVADTNSAAINTKSFSVTNTFTVTVNESNRPPVLTLPTNATVNELVAYANTASATDPDSPLNPLTYALVSGPTGLVVNASSGAINWTPSEFQGPGVYPVQIKVSDSNPLAVNATSLSVTSSYTLTVSEVNLAPVVGALAPQSGNPGQTISFTATATDADLPTNTLSFSLVSPPAGASIVAGSGLFSWRLPAALANTTNTLAIRVTDNGSPNLSGTNTFLVTVGTIAPVVLTPLGYSGGQFRLSVTGSLGPDYVLQGSTNLSNFTDLATNTPAAMPFNFTNISSGIRMYRVRLMP